MYKGREQRTSPVKAIREHCRECMDDLAREIQECPGEGKCQLWPFRFGKNPFRTKQVLTEDQKEKLRAGARKAREAKEKRKEEE